MSTLRMVYTNSFGDQTDITKTTGDDLDSLYFMIRECLLGMGFSPELVEKLMPAEEK